MSDQPTPLLSIGELSRATGLSVSALRFYDRQGVLTPATVDAWSSYRRYAPGQVREGRLLAGMRRVQMPVPEMATSLEAYRAGDREVVLDLLHAHLRRLEEGLTDARREITRLSSSLDDLASAVTPPATAYLDAATLREALATVRHAVGTDPDFPALQGVLMELEGPELTMVATDRYRLALARTRVGLTDPDSVVTTSASALLAHQEITRLDHWLAARNGEITVHLDAEQVVVSDREGTQQIHPTLDEVFPDYRRILPGTSGGEVIESARVRAALASESASVGLGPLSVNREFLWEALRSIPDGQVVLPTDGVIAPLMIRSPQDRVLALVMPIAEEAG